MKSSNLLSKPPSLKSLKGAPKPKFLPRGESGSLRWIMTAVIPVSFLGFLDSAYLSAEHFLGRVPSCSIIEGCEKVLQGPYSEIFGIPVALFGVFYYLSVFILAILWFDIRKRAILSAIFLLSLAAFSASLYFVYLQLFVIKAICLYCMFSAGTSGILFILSVLALKLKGRKSN